MSKKVEGVLQNLLANADKERNFQRINYEFGVDSSGDDALWVDVELRNRDKDYSAEEYEKMSVFANKCEARMRSIGLSAWPYVNFIQAKS